MKIEFFPEEKIEKEKFFPFPFFGIFSRCRVKRHATPLLSFTNCNQITPDSHYHLGGE
jgi:hypothetical protein